MWNGDCDYKYLSGKCVASHTLGHHISKTVYITSCIMLGFLFIAQSMSLFSNIVLFFGHEFIERENIFLYQILAFVALS